MATSFPMSDSVGESLKLIKSAFERLGIRYVVGGSLASSARGIWRSTLDVDLVAAIHPAQAGALVKALGADWYADADMIRHAIQAGRSFNIIHIGFAQKVDVFPATGAFHDTQLDRATIAPVGLDGVPCPVATAEDILLAKLRWYRDGGEVSDRQWNDITGLIATNAALDFDYTRTWAARLRVEDLLDRAIADVERDQPL
jgi:hypothetical protein